MKLRYSFIMFSKSSMFHSILSFPCSLYWSKSKLCGKNLDTMASNLSKYNFLPSLWFCTPNCWAWILGHCAWSVSFVTIGCWHPNQSPGCRNWFFLSVWIYNLLFCFFCYDFGMEAIWNGINFQIWNGSNQTRLYWLAF